MLARLRPEIIAAGVLAAVVGADAQPRPPADPIRRPRRPVADRYIVVVHPQDDPDAIAAASAQIGGGRIRRVYRHAVRGFSMTMPEAAAQRVARDPRVAYVEQDGVTVGDQVSAQSSPFNWGLDRIDQRGLPLDGQFRFAADGSGVNAYVMDSGIRARHPGFEGRAVGAVNVTDDGIPSDQDCDGHGTHVSGILGSGPAGVAKGVTLYSVKVLNCESTGTWSEYIAGIDWVIANHRKPAVINASIGGGYLSAVHEAVRRAVANGITFVASAGNGSSDACGAFPGAVSEIIAVGSSSVNDIRASYSNYGPCVDLFAPGVDITSLSNLDNGNTVRSGTSMAAPHVAGAAALYLQRHPDASPEEVRAALTNAATRNVVVNAGLGPNLLLYTAYLGDAVVPAVAITSPAAGATIRETVTAAASASDDVEMREVQFRVSGTLIGRDVTAPYAVALDTTKFANGAHVLEALAVDVAGNVNRRTVPVTIQNVAASGSWISGAVGGGDDGHASYAGSTFVVEGGGSQLWGASDMFQFAHQPWTGDGDLIASLASLTRPSDATQAMAGLMFRESLASESRHVAIVISSDGKLKFRRRTQTGGDTASDGPVTGSTYVPRWLKLSRRGNVFAAAVSADGRSWTAVHVPQTVALPQSLHVGVLALRSGGTGLARATFSHLGLGRVPDGWTPIDLGAVGAPGRTEHLNGEFVVKAAGAELWGSEDAAHFVHRQWSGDVDVIARVTHAVAPTGSAVALAAVSIRESLAANARHASMVVTSEGKAKFRRRIDVGGATLSDGPSAGSVTLPRWIRLRRSGQYITAYLSTDGIEWQQVHTTQLMPLSTSVHVGLLGLRSGGSALADVRFDQVAIR